MTIIWFLIWLVADRIGDREGVAQVGERLVCPVGVPHSMSMPKTIRPTSRVIECGSAWLPTKNLRAGCGCSPSASG
jgi:hypothetical protein